jgi:hypothetical protein
MHDLASIARQTGLSAYSSGESQRSGIPPRALSGATFPTGPAPALVRHGHAGVADVCP